MDEMWQHLDFGSAWYSAKQRDLAERMVHKFLAWHRDNPRELVAVEQELAVRAGQVTITGQVDRLERDADGTAIVVDIKTGSSRPADADLDRNPQLGVYQLAVMLGAFEELGLTEPGGAELVQVGKAAPGRQRAGAAAAEPVQRPRAGLGPRAGRHGRGRDDRAGVPGQRQPRLPGLPAWPPAARCTSAARR